MYHSLLATVDVVEWLHHDDSGNGWGNNYPQRREAAIRLRNSFHQRLVSMGEADQVHRLMLSGAAGYPGIDELEDLSLWLGCGVELKLGEGEGAVLITYGDSYNRLCRILHSGTTDAGHWELSRTCQASHANALLSSFWHGPGRSCHRQSGSSWNI